MQTRRIRIIAIIVLVLIIITSFFCWDVNYERIAEGYYYIDEDSRILNQDNPLIGPGYFSATGFALYDDIWAPDEMLDLNGNHWCFIDDEIVNIKDSNDEGHYTSCVMSEDGEYFITHKGYYNIDFKLEIEIPYDEEKGYFKPNDSEIARSFSENGLAAVPVASKEGGNKISWGFIDKTGKFIIAPQYDEVSDFGNSKYAAVKDKEGLWKYIDSEGHVVSKDYNYAGPFAQNGLACAIDDDSLTGYINENFEYVIAPHYKNARKFGDNGFARVSEDGKNWGYIDTAGNVVIDYQFLTCEDFNDGLAPVNVSGKWGYINEMGEFIIEPQFSEAHVFSDNGTALVKVGGAPNQKDDGLYGYINSDGSWFLKPQFEMAYDYRNGYASIKLQKNQKIKK